MIPALAYYRTSNRGNIDDSDSRPRQEGRVMAWAEANGYNVAGSYYDAGVSGTVSVLSRPAFKEMYDRAVRDGIRVILIETADRFARDAVIQITCHDMLRESGIDLIAVDSPSHFLEDTPTSRMIRGILAHVSEFHKESSVRRMKEGKERKRRAGGYIGGIPAMAPERRAEVVRLRGLGLSCREVAVRVGVSHSIVARIAPGRAGRDEQAA